MKITSGVIASAMVFAAAMGSANAACYEFTVSATTFVFNVTETAEGKNTFLAGIGYVPSAASGVAIGGIVDFVSSTPPPGPKLLTINWAVLGVETCLLSSALASNGAPVGSGLIICSGTPTTVTLVKAACSTVPPPNAPAGNTQGLLSLLHGAAAKAAQ